MLAASSEQRVGVLIRDLREARRLSVRTLASRAGFSPSFISQVENGQASPSISSLERIAGCLGVTLVEFFQATEVRSAPVIRASERPRLESGWSKANIERLNATGMSKLEPVMITIAPGGASGKKVHAQPREEFAIVFEGEITLVMDGEDHVLRRGDAVTIQAQRPLRWINQSSETAQILLVAARFL